jgi:hypothetical protein
MNCGKLHVMIVNDLKAIFLAHCFKLQGFYGMSHKISSSTSSQPTSCATIHNAGTPPTKVLISAGHLYKESITELHTIHAMLTTILLQVYHSSVFVGTTKDSNM